ncbi:polyketide synthase [Niastella vici]|uniref:Polyketide synthase n=1 Tax=Niastella vici TaxID=1703345 RepID=A0A1V9FRS3_9BACT|nr:MBL fold metallo-hydrolase [Niastella vici]OQP61089.1 polyketide synthase [Niastella vici]
MNGKKVYLKPNVVLEPLVMNWYAWPHLISPATLAMNIVGRHLKIMNSYIRSPEIHRKATLDPKMRGGPFMDYKESRQQEIRQLKQETIVQQSRQIELAEAIVELDEMIRRNAKGASMESLYEKVPDLLKGYVELVYDLNNNASFRLFESLLYNSEFYNKSFQSIALWTTCNDERPFCLSVARLEEPGVLQLNIPFEHEGVDALSRMKKEAAPLEEIAALLNVPAEKRPLFNSLFTEEQPPAYNRYSGDKARMRYFGHACILIETSEISILVDPVISYYGYDYSVDRFTDADLPDHIDFVLITHNHQDHILFETLLPLRHRIGTIIVPKTTSGALQDPDLKKMFNAIGFKNVVEIDDMEKLEFGEVAVRGIPFTGEHSDLNIRTKSCYHVAVEKFTFLLMADSRIVEPRLYGHVHDLIGDVDVLFLGMECDGAPLSWLYGPLLTEELSRDKDQSRRLSGSDCKKGMALVDIFRPAEVYVYAMGQEPWIEFISSIKYTPESNPIIQSDKLIAECTAQGRVAERLFGEKELLYSYRNRQVSKLQHYEK